ncbi:Auxin-responsive protein SAUR50-like protein [Drosera capensis]
MAIRKSNKISQPTVIKQIIRTCSSLGKKNGSYVGVLPVDVPKGHFAMHVGENRARYIVPLSLLSHPQFQCLLQCAEEDSDLTTRWGIEQLWSSQELVSLKMTGSKKTKREGRDPKLAM